MPNSELVRFQVNSKAIVAVLNVEKILDDKVIKSIEDLILPQLHKYATDNLIIDFSKVNFLTSSFLGFLIRLSKYVYQNNGQLRLCGIDNKIQDIFRITRLDKIFDIHADIEKALLSIGQD
jgi:anti-sigma B factor antagonist